MCTQSPGLSHWALSGDHNFLFALPRYPSGVGVSSHITGEDCRMAQRQHHAAPPKWGEGLTPRADDYAGPLPSASRWSTIAPFAGTRRSCDRWQLAERCPGHSPPCPCSTCAQASGCLPRWTAPRCPSSWTSTEGLPRWVRLGCASFISWNKAASLLRLEWVVGLGEVKGGAHRPVRVWGSNVAGWEGLSGARAMPPNARLGVGGSGWGRQENPGLDLTAPHSIFPLPFQLQPWPHPLFSRQLKEQPPPRAASFLLTLAPGLTVPRLGTSRAREAGAVWVSGVNIRRMNPCHATHPRPPLQPPATPPLTAPGCPQGHLAISSSSLEERGTCCMWP